jgi:hypothetical protein
LTAASVRRLLAIFIPTGIARRGTFEIPIVFLRPKRVCIFLRLDLNQTSGPLLEN